MYAAERRRSVVERPTTSSEQTTGTTTTAVTTTVSRGGGGEIEEGLKDEGFVVVRSALSGKKAERLLRKAKKEAKVLPHLAHSEAAWEIRTSERVRGAFERAWGGERRLVTSFEGMSFRGRGEVGLELPAHVDRRTRGGSVEEEGWERRCVQGIVALTDSDERTGSVGFLPGSHHEYESLLERNCSSPLADEEAERGSWQFFRVKEGDPVTRRKPFVVPRLRKGDMVLWDSRTVHRVERGTEAGRRSRVVAYVCMSPRSLASSRTLRRRRRAFLRGSHSTHCPNFFVCRGIRSRPPCRSLLLRPDVLSLV